jgi:hypothetical protein
VYRGTAQYTIDTKWFRKSTIKIPNSVTKIKRGAFLDNNNTTNIEIPGSVDFIDIVAFDGTKWFIELLEEADEFNVINNTLIKYNGKDSKIVIPEGITQIYESAFSGNEHITSVIIPEGVTHIGSNAFFNCKKLEDIVIPQSVIHIGGSAFNNTIWFENKTDDFVIINGNLLKYQGEDDVIEIPYGVTNIASGIFGVHYLKPKYISKINIPNSVIQLNTNPFAYTNGLDVLELPNSIRYIATRGLASANVSHIKIPYGVTHIPHYLFYSGSSFNNKLESVELPDSIIHIESFAFIYAYDLKELVIPKSVNHIGRHAFLWSGIEKIYVYDEAFLNGVELEKDFYFKEEARWGTIKNQEIEVILIQS